MSWFKRGSFRREEVKATSSPRKSLDPIPSQRVRAESDTDPETCLEVFQTHWLQAWRVINSRQSGSVFTSDEVEVVTHNFEQMVTLLVQEDESEMPGPILLYLLEHKVLVKFNAWCMACVASSDNLRYEQLRMYELLISQSQQTLLRHQGVTQPLLHLLSSYSNEFRPREIEGKIVSVLHQLCVCLSQETMLLESFFLSNTDHGPAKFLIFSLLIPFIHREGKVGQHARDALLLIMALSTKHPNIGNYIAEHSHFCPVLATGLSGLYSSLPRKVTLPMDDWYQISYDDSSIIPDLNLFLNSLEFCNAVVQIAHPSVRDQLINYIYNGFLVPVLGPALHQNSREEVITATAYLDLFLRRITEPILIKAFLKFVLTEKYDEIIILDSLITRINSNTRLSLVSLSLFQTLISLNCEDAMYQLVFKYLIPCTHVMVSQRRAVKKVDTYCKSAEKFLSLRPSCCMPDLSDSPSNSLISANRLGVNKLRSSQTEADKNANKGLGGIFKRRKQKQEQRTNLIEAANSAFPPGSYGNKLEHFETSYLEYLQEARQQTKTCTIACRFWSSPYDGDHPSPTSIRDMRSSASNKRRSRVSFSEASSLGPEDSRTSSMVTNQTNASDISSLTCNGLKDQSLEMSKDGSPMLNDVKVFVSVDSNSNNMTPLISDAAIFVDETRGSRSDSKSSNGSISSEQDLIQTDIRKSLLISSQQMVGLQKIPEKIEIRDHRSISFGSATSGVSNGESLPDSIITTDSCSTLNSEDFSHLDSRSMSSEALSDDLESFITYLSHADSSMTYTDDDDEEDGFCIIDSFMVSLSGQTSDASSVGQILHISSLSGVSPLPDEPSEYGAVVSPPGSSLVAGLEDATISSPILHEGSFSSNTNSSSKEPSEQGIKSDNTSFVEISMSSLNRSENDQTLSMSSMSMHMSSDSMQPSRGASMEGPSYASCPPNIGPFLSALFTKLESMLQNSLSVNLVLTGLIASLAAYPQPLLRSFLLNHNLVFQPSVKSLVQVLSTARQKIDQYSYTIRNFDFLLLQCRRFLAMKEEMFVSEAAERAQRTSSVSQSPSKSPIPLTTREKQRTSLSDRLFKRSSIQEKDRGKANRQSPLLERMTDLQGYRYNNRRQIESIQSGPESQKTKNAVYCAVILEEFVKELAALAQEHAILCTDEGYMSS